jgi:hypothetical protein
LRCRRVAARAQPAARQAHATRVPRPLHARQRRGGGAAGSCVAARGGSGLWRRAGRYLPLVSHPNAAPLAPPPCCAALLAPVADAADVPQLKTKPAAAAPAKPFTPAFKSAGTAPPAKFGGAPSFGGSKKADLKLKARARTRTRTRTRTRPRTHAQAAARCAARQRRQAAGRPCVVLRRPHACTFHFRFRFRFRPRARAWGLRLQRAAADAPPRSLALRAPQPGVVQMVKTVRKARAPRAAQPLLPRPPPT